MHPPAISSPKFMSSGLGLTATGLKRVNGSLLVPACCCCEGRERMGPPLSSFLRRHLPALPVWRKCSMTGRRPSVTASIRRRRAAGLKKMAQNRLVWVYIIFPKTFHSNPIRSRFGDFKVGPYLIGITSNPFFPN